MKLPVSPPPLQSLIARELSTPEGRRRFTELAAAGLGPAPGGKYRHWDTFRHAPPLADLDVELQWLVVKFARTALYRPIPLNDSRAQPFKFALPSIALEYVHRVERDAAGTIQGAAQITDPSTQATYLFKALVEEAITSSQLEGASTTRRVAKAMIQEGRAPRDRSEWMILNNYEGMRLLRELRDAPLSPAVVMRLHRVLMDGTLDDPTAAGRFRRAEDEIVIENETGTLLHTPPPAAELKARMAAMCTFANGDGSGEFIPPPVRAILLHFWLAYDHPFVDGNGRMARALFYWSMARQGYWLCEYLSISRILKNARGEYSRAYLYTETDDNDATYFLLYQLGVLCRSISELHQYLARKAAQLKETEQLVRRARAVKGVLNPRQLALVHHALRKSDARYTLESHRRSHGVSFETARGDLASLATQKLLVRGKVGRQFVYRPAPDLQARIEDKVKQAKATKRARH